MEEVPEDLSLSYFFSFEKTFSEFSHKIFIIILHNTNWLRKFPIVCQPIITQNYNVHSCYTFCTGVILELQC